MVFVLHSLKNDRQRHMMGGADDEGEEPDVSGVRWWKIIFKLLLTVRLMRMFFFFLPPPGPEVPCVPPPCAPSAPSVGAAAGVGAPAADTGGSGQPGPGSVE